ncbi:galactosyltransferase-domain-containing protein [Pterulicium gracile]|uniref:Hexosyltransferase n=1 Tax=Pterulicium gracile TaxID=1884261 RepID=A0A5C3QJL3_9AGAR|nr:galactosyltransferase-domain-containing protein [Pterula gracilis]
MRSRHVKVLAALVVIVFISLLFLDIPSLSFNSLDFNDPQQPTPELQPYSSYSEINFTLPSGTLDPTHFFLTQNSRPEWHSSPRLDKPPLSFRIGIISHPSEFAKRHAIREYILSSVPTTACTFTYRFLLASSPPSASHDDHLVLQEIHEYNDIVLLDMHEDPRRMAEKRWRVLRWAAEANRETYDYFLAFDTDVFIRIHALALRIRTMHPEFKPRQESIMWAQMQSHKVHFVHRPDSDSDPNSYLVEDDQVFLEGEYRGPEWYPYPMGFGFLMSSHLVSRLNHPKLKLPHHVHFPSDDVVMGMWVSEWAGDTKIVRDKAGFHEPTGHDVWKPEDTAPITWESVVLHHVKPWEYRELRKVEEWEGEWTPRA